MIRKFAMSASVIATALLAGSLVVSAQQAGKGSGSGSGSGSGMSAGSGSGSMAKKKGMMGSGDCPMMGQMMKGGDMAAHIDSRVATLRTRLAITPAQQGPWEAYAAALKKQMTAMHASHQSTMAAQGAKSPIERLDSNVASMEGRLAGLKDVRPALSALYATFSDEQKSKANEALGGGACMM